MLARILTVGEYENWNYFVDLSPQGSIYCKTWWLNIVTNENFEICAVVNDAEEIIAGLILPNYKSGFVKQPNLTSYLGLLFFDAESQNNIRLQKYLTIQKECTQLILNFISVKCKYFDFKCNYNYIYWSPLKWNGFKQTTAYTYIIDFKNYNPDVEFKRFSKGHKWIINKVEKKSDLYVCEATVEEYLELSHNTYKRQGVKRSYDDEIIIKIDNVLKEHNASKILKIVDSQNRIHAVEYFLYTNKEAYYWLGASDNELRDSGGHTALTWYAIKYFSDKVLKFNFCGSMLEDVDRNFRNFSAFPTPYYRIYKLPFFYKMGKEILESIKQK